MPELDETRSKIKTDYDRHFQEWKHVLLEDGSRMEDCLENDLFGFLRIWHSCCTCQLETLHADQLKAVDEDVFQFLKENPSLACGFMRSTEYLNMDGHSDASWLHCCDDCMPCDE